MPQTTTQTKPHFSILATSFAGGPPPRRTATIIFGLWFLLFFAALFTPPLLDDADATHAQAAQAMARTGDLVTLHVDGIRYLEKAPLPYWLAAASFKLFGENTFAAHLPQALAVLLLVLLGYRWANQAFGSRTGFYTALALLTSTGVFLFTRILIPEVLLSLTLAAALFAFLKSLGPISPPARVPHDHRSEAKVIVGGVGPQPPAPELERPSLAWYAGPLFYPYVMWASLALAVLAKGLVALVFFFTTTCAFLLLTAEHKNWRKLRPFSGLLLFLAIAAPWHILAGLRNPGFFWFYFYNEHVLRFLGRRLPADYNRMPAYLYWLGHFLWLFPWSLFLPLGLAALYRRLKHQQLLTRTATIPGAPSFPAPPERVGYRAHGSTALLDPTTSPGAPGLASETWAEAPQKSRSAAQIVTAYLIILTAPLPFSKLSGTSISEYLTLVLPTAACLLIPVTRRRAGLIASPFHRIDPQQRTLLLLSLFAAVVLLFFSLSTNQEYYTFPAYLPLLLLIAATVTRAEQTYSTNPSAVRWVNFAHAAFTFLGLAAAGALLYGLFASRHLPFVDDIGDVLAHRGVGSYTLATSHLFDLTTNSFAALRLPAALAALTLLVGPAVAWALRTQRRHLAATTCIAFTAAGLLFSAHIAFARFAPLLSSKSFAEEIREFPPETPVLLFGDQAYGSSIPFYLGRPVSLVDGRTTSMQFGSTFPDVPSTTFLTLPALQQRWTEPARLLLFVPEDRREEALQLLPHPTILLDEGGKLLLTNH